MSKKELIKIETYYDVEKNNLEIDTKISLMMKCVMVLDVLILAVLSDAVISPVAAMPW